MTATRVCGNDETHVETETVSTTSEITKQPTIGAKGETTYTSAAFENPAFDVQTKTVDDIDKVDPTQLTDAIAAAQAAESGVATSTDGKDVEPPKQWTTAAEKKALDDAIAAAQEVADDASATQAQVDAAAAAVEAATSTYEAAKKAGTKAATPAVTVSASLKDATITNVTDRRYTGKAITQSPVIQLSGKKLKVGTDYTLSYKNNTKVGTATVTATGKGNYTGSISKTFKIVKAVGWERLAGASGTGALGTQAKILAKFSTKTKVAVVATNQSFKDALASVALAGSEDAPIVTTAPSSLSDLARSELERLGITKVYIVGTTGDVSANVEAQIKALPKVAQVVRVSAGGAAPKAVAAAKATSMRSKTVIIATQKSFKDALSISPYAYATHSPILYVESNLTLSSATLAYIQSAGFTQAIIVGGPVAIPTSVETQLAGAGIAKSKQTRLAGKACYGTSRAIAEWATGMYKNGSSYKAGLYNQYTSVKFQPSIKFNANDLGVSRGDGWKDALAGAALCGSNQSVLLLADGSNYAQATAFVQANKAQINKGYVFGGTQAVITLVYKALVAASK